jgi:hypothetical protein
LALVTAPILRIGVSVVTGLVAFNSPVAANDNLHAVLSLCGANKRILDNAQGAATVAVGIIAIVAFFVARFYGITTANGCAAIKATGIARVCPTIGTFGVWRPSAGVQG